MVMLKDNHIASAGGITSAVETARRAAGFSMKIEVSVVLERAGNGGIATFGRAKDHTIITALGCARLEAIDRDSMWCNKLI